MVHSMRLMGFILVALGCVSQRLRADEGKKTDTPTLRDLSQEVAALQTLYQLQLTRPQLVALKEMSRDTADKAKAAEPGKDNEKVRKAFVNLREALVKAKDPDKITEFAEALDEVQQSEKPELNDDLDLTEDARAQAPKLLKLLSPRQAAAYGGILSDEIGDPVEQLQEALAKARGLGEKDWKEFRVAVADEVGRLLGGVDAEKADEFGNKAIQLMIVSRGLSDDEFKTQRADLDKKVRDLAAGMGPTEIVRNAIEYRLAELLSNPRLTAALDARLK